jgi:hypothetical protein
MPPTWLGLLMCAVLVLKVENAKCNYAFIVFSLNPFLGGMSFLQAAQIKVHELKF